MSDPFSASRESFTDTRRDFVPLPLPKADSAHHRRSLRRHPVRIATIAFSFLAAAASWYALLAWLIPDPVPALPLLLLAFLCPTVLVLTGFWLISSVRSGYRISLLALVVSIGVTLLWWYGGNLDTMRERIDFAVAIIGPAVVMLLLSRYLMNLRRSHIMRPIL